jgi:hypothetical protein
VAIGLALAGATVALAFLTSGGSDPRLAVTGSFTWPEIAATLLGTAGCATAVLVGARGRGWGATTAGLFAAFTAFAGLSILWSVQPDWSWYGANELLSYLSVFAGAAALGRVFPERWPAIIGGVAAAASALCAYALLAKVFPATLDSLNKLGRLQAPFGYWNASGAIAAMGLPACLWWGSRRGVDPVPRALSAPAVTLAISVVVLSYSRSSLLVAILGAAVWLALVPSRLRAISLLAVGAAGALPIVLWALGHSAISGGGVPPGTQDAAGHSFGIVLVVVLLVVAGAGVAVSAASDRVTIGPDTRRRIQRGLLVVPALVPLVAVVALAMSHRGFTGEISHVWSSLTSSTGGAPDNSAQRITQLGSSRPMYWHQAITVGGHALLKGAGELGYGIARLRYTALPDKSDQAHGYLMQTFADLGLVGLVLTVALVISWVIAALRALAPGLAWSRLSPAAADEREGLLALAAVVIAFGIQSGLDWTFYFPGVAIPALVCAGWVAGRGPLRHPIGRRAERPSLIARPGAGALVTGLATLALIGAWLMWQPLRSAQDIAAADAASTTSAAFSYARAAASDDPLAYQPLVLLSSLYQSIKQPVAARAELRKAVALQPDNAEPLVALGNFELADGDPRQAILTMARVAALDHTSDYYTRQAQTTVGLAQAALAARSSGGAPITGRAPARGRAATRAGSRAGGRRTRK